MRFVLPSLIAFVAGTLQIPLLEAQSRGRLDLTQTSTGCNLEEAQTENGEQPAGCSLTATVRDARGRPASGQQVQLFRADDDFVEDEFFDDDADDDDEDNDGNQGFTPFGRQPRTTGRSGTATFRFQSPDEGTCYQARSRNLALNSNILCISPDGTTSFTENGEETTIVE